METSKEYYPVHHKEYYPMKEYASKGVAGTGLGLAAASLGLLLANGGLGGLGFGRGGFGCGHGCGDGCHGGHERGVDRFELLQSEKIACLEAANAREAAKLSANIARLEAEKYTDCKVAALGERMEVKIDTLAGAVERRIDGVVAHTNAKFEHVEHAICNQNIINAKLDGVVACQEGQILNLTHRLNRVTKEVIPKDVICPEVMPRYNYFVTPSSPPVSSELES